MARRALVLQTGRIYHIFNRSIAKERILKLPYQQKRLLQCAEYYSTPTVAPFSLFQKAHPRLRRQIIAMGLSQGKKIELLAYAIMPTHYHFLLIQKSHRGIYSFIRNVQISYAKYYNKLRGRHGGVFCHGFGSVKIQSDFHLLYVSKYIHLNPVHDGLLSKEDLKYSPSTSFSAYCGNLECNYLNLQPLISLCDSQNAYCKYILNI